MSNKKLHPIYVALDAHQYNRAIKLGAALPDDNVLGKALLAHAYSKSGQRYSALLTLHNILGGFCELKHEVECSLQTLKERQQSSSKTISQPEPQAHSSSKKGKKGKKKPAPVTKQQQAACPESDCSGWDLIDQLNTQPALPEKWEDPPADKQAITDETTLATLSVTFNRLKLPLTAYQMYAWASQTERPSEVILTKTFCLGLTVLAAPSKWKSDSHTKIRVHILAHMQAVALQWARLVVSQQPASAFPSMLATAWASQTALWQLEWLPDDQQRSLILPRLGESMARRLIQQEGEQSSPSAEIQLLCLRTLEYQSKWSEMLELLEKLPVPSSDDGDEQQPPTISSEFGVALTTQQILTQKARILSRLEQYEAARKVYENLLKTSPDDWSCWKGHLEGCIKSDKLDLTDSLVEMVLTQQADSKYPLRGPHLMKVEIAAHRVRTETTNDGHVRALATTIQDYSQLFAPRAACTFSDLDTYIELLARTNVPSTNAVIQSLLDFSEKMRKGNSSSKEGENVSNKERQSKLRSYIFATKLNHKLISIHKDFEDRWLPNWSKLVNEWQTTLSLSSSNEGEETQKELKPGDELVLLAVQQLLYKNADSDEARLTCAVLLETAIKHSPDNAYLKIAAIDVYYQLNAMSRSWEFFQAMGIKHIQLDSCIYTVLPLLLEGGLYTETIELCNALLRFQATTARDCGDYAGRAMEAGILSKANEFMLFQSHKMNKSLSVVEAKGLILDAAALLATVVPRKKHDEDPVLKGGLGIHQGIVGGDNDLERATRMVVEAHNPYAALSLVSWADNGGSMENSKDMADNRDMSILFLQILYKTKILSKESIMQDALRRGHMHGMLIRATLCLDAAKGPKKGKIVKSSAELEKRTISLLDCVSRTADFVDNHEQAEGNKGPCCKALVHSTLALCRVLAMIMAGLPQLDNDILEEREQHAFDLFQNKALVQLKQAKQNLSLSSVKDVCSLLPNYIVPLFAVFKMCSNICSAYGWGKRKRDTKRCAGAMADFAAEFNSIIEKMLSCLESLPSSESPSADRPYGISEEHSKLLGGQVVRETTDLLFQGQYRTRVRVEPILHEMDEYLDSFLVSDS